MSETLLATASARQVWQKKYFQEYVRMSGYLPYMTNTNVANGGPGNKNGIILTGFNDGLRDAGTTINIPFIGRLKSQGVLGSGILTGNEETLTNYNCPIAIDWRRNAVTVPKSTSFQTEVDLWNAAKDMLKIWEAEKQRDDITRAFMAAVVDTNGTTVNWDVATTANKNTWTAANSDRILFGNAIGNYNATFSTAAAGANMTASAGKVTAAGASLAKRIAKLSDPHIRPYTTESGREYYVAFHGTRSFRDLKLDATIVAANTNARAREGDGMDKNPLFQDGDILYDGVIHHEVPEIDAMAAAAGFNGIGNSGADLRPIFVCGAGAVGCAWGQMPTMRTDLDRDYGFRPGVGIEELLGIKKISFNGAQNGMVTWIAAAAADN